MALKENYRELLIDAVVRVAAREGLDRTTTKLIAAEVPCNEVYIYRNFGSKDALLQAAFSRTDLRFVQTILKNLDVMDAPGQPLDQGGVNGAEIRACRTFRLGRCRFLKFILKRGYIIMNRTEKLIVALPAGVDVRKKSTRHWNNLGFN